MIVDEAIHTGMLWRKIMDLSYTKQGDRASGAIGWPEHKVSFKSY